MRTRIAPILAIAISLMANQAFAHGGAVAAMPEGRGGGGAVGGHFSSNAGSANVGSAGSRPSFAFGGSREGSSFHYGGYGHRGYIYYDSYPYYYDDGSDGNPVYYSSDYDGDSGTIAQVQTALTNLGYYHGPATGAIGPRTSAAISAYQNDQGLPVTGTVTTAVLHSLNLD